MPSSSSAARASHADKVPLAAWLLLLLRDGESYGRALFGALADRGIAVDAGLAYRTLRALESDGAITSQWTPSHHGPRRRSYRLTRKGRRRLAQLAADITATCHLHEAFVRAYDARSDIGHEDGEHGPTGDPGEPSQQPAEAERAISPEAPAHDAPAPTVGRELLVGWLLLLLHEDESYGYGLRQALDERDVRADAGALYRVLRALERDGLLQSRWMKSAAGPRRRFYRLTARGRRSLDELAGAIAATRDHHATFLRIYEQTPRRARRRRSADPRQ